jgi:hypothetical protein
MMVEIGSVRGMVDRGVFGETILRKFPEYKV